MSIDGRCRRIVEFSPGTIWRRRCILYIVRRTQLYLDDDLWQALHVRSRETRTTISELVREAVRERYLSTAAARKEAMTAFAGAWKDRPEFADPEAYVRSLRQGRRLQRLRGE
jgi:hypothetical protein